MYMLTRSSRVKARERGSALLIVLVVALVALASLVGIATFRKSAIPSSPASYQAQIVSATPTPSPIAFVQSNSATLSGQKSSITASFSNTQSQGNLNVVIIGWQGGGNSVSNVTDTLGNTYTLVLQNHGTGISQALYYAKNIKSGTGNAVTATYASAAFAPHLIILEYKNADTQNPLNASHFQSGTSTVTPSSGLATNITAGELLVGAGVTNKLYTSPGPNYTQRVITSNNSKGIAEDRIVSSSGSYDASATLNDSTGYYVMQIATFKPAPAPSVTPTPSPTPTPTPTATPLPSTVRVNVGGPQYTDSAGNVWSADTGFTGGTTYANTNSIANTADPTLYHTERYGAFQYALPVANGSYTVTLKFAETYLTGAGQRVFNVTLNGATVLSNFDIYAAAGGMNIAVDKTFPVSVTGGQISLNFIANVENPKVNAIQIVPGAAYAYSQSAYYTYSQSTYYAYSQEARSLRQQATEEMEVLLGRSVSRLCCSSNWATMTVAELVGVDSLRNGKSVKPTGDYGEVRCLTLSAVRRGRIDLRDSKVVPMTREEAKPFLVSNGDVFVVRGNGSKNLCGMAGLVAEDSDSVIFPDLFIRVPIPVQVMLPEFFVAAWNSATTREVIEDKAKTTSGIWKINQGHIISTVIQVPPLSEQRRIVADLDDLQKQADALKALQAETSAELAALMPSILDKAFRGEL
jgi:Malectin domain